MRTIQPVVIRGGFGRNKDKSIESGAFILEVLRNKYFDPTDLLIDSDGLFVDGKRIKEEELSKLGDVYINTLSEDSLLDIEFRKRLERRGVYFLGSPTDSSLLSFHKHGAKEVFNDEGIRTPQSRLFRDTEDIHLDILRSFNFPLILKPTSSNYSFGVVLVNNRKELNSELREAFSLSDRVLVEEYIPGKEISCSLVQNFRNEPLYSFPLAEIIRDGKISDEELKRSGKYGAIFPARITINEANLVRELTRKAHHSLGLNHYSRADCIVSPKGIYLLEINSSPEINRESLFHQSLEAGGMSSLEFFEHLIGLTLDK